MGISEGYGIGSLKPGVCTSSTRPASPFDGQVVYMTDVDQTAIWDGSAWVGLDPSRDRNVIINGAMQVAQRGTSSAGNTTGSYRTADRFVTDITNAGTWTETIENDAPTGTGFRKSLKMLCTTADTSLATTDRLIVQQQLEGQNLQHFQNGTSSAKPFTVSFWVKSNVTGTYIVELEDWDSSKQVSASYTVSSSATWEKKTVTFPANTVNTFDNDNNKSLGLYFWLAAGPSFTTGTLQTTWGNTTANRIVGQTNLAAATNNYWQVTGVQLEAGAVATPFEFEDIGVTFTKCQRYFQQYDSSGNVYTLFGLGKYVTASSGWAHKTLPTNMRAVPTLTSSTVSNFAMDNATGTLTALSAFVLNNASNANLIRFQITVGSSPFVAGHAGELLSNNTTAASIQLSSEL